MARWRDLTYSRTLVPEAVEVAWLATDATATSDLPALIESTDPLGEILASASFADRDEVVQALQQLDTTLASDADRAYSYLVKASDERFAQLRTERSLTALTSVAITVLGIGLAWLTISEVRRRRRVEAAHAEAIGQLADKAERDPSTGAWNRRRLESSVSEMITTARGDEIVVLVYLDLDHFKSINDVWGHNTGDKVLYTVTERLRGFTYELSLIHISEPTRPY